MRSLSPQFLSQQIYLDSIFENILLSICPGQSLIRIMVISVCMVQYVLNL